MSADAPHHEPDDALPPGAPTVGCLQNAIGLLAVGAAGAAVLGYVALLTALGAKGGFGNFVGGVLVTVSAALNTAYWGYRLTGSEALAAEYGGAIRYVLRPFNVLFGLYAAALLLAELRAGRNPAGGFALTLWAVGPAVISLSRLGRRLADRVLPAETRPELHATEPDPDP